MRVIEIGRVSPKNYPDRTTGFDGYVVLPEGFEPCRVDDKHRVAWEAKQAVVRLVGRTSKQHVATLTCMRGKFAVREGEIKLADETVNKQPWKVTLRARNNGSFAVMFEQQGAPVQTEMRL